MLGAILINPGTLPLVISVLGTSLDNWFAIEHQIIFNSMLKLFEQNIPVDTTTLLTRLMEKGQLENMGGATCIAALTGCVPTSANVEHYAKMVQQAAQLRRIITVCAQIEAAAYLQEQPAPDLLASLEQKIFNLARVSTSRGLEHVANLITPAVQAIEQRLKNDGIIGLSTGYKLLDELTGGLAGDDFIIVAARPSLGKTAFAMNLALKVARQKRHVVFFSLEMNKPRLMERLFAMISHVTKEDLRGRAKSRQEIARLLSKAASEIQQLPLYIDESSNINPLELRAMLRRHMVDHPVDLIIVDYLQLMSGGGSFEKRNEEIASISRGLKATAREARAPLIALSQLTREAETTRPRLSHLRESGAIEQDADIVILLSNSAKTSTNILVDVAKQRNGETGSFELEFIRPFQLMQTPERWGHTEPPPGTRTQANLPYADDEEDVPL